MRNTKYFLFDSYCGNSRGVVGPGIILWQQPWKHRSQVIKFLTTLRLGLSHLREHKFRHSFHNSLNPLCKCGAEVESTTHFLLHCPIYNNDRSSLLSTIRNIDCKLLEITDSSLSQTLLYGNPYFDIITNSLILIIKQ